MKSYRQSKLIIKNKTPWEDELAAAAPKMAGHIQRPFPMLITKLHPDSF